MLKAIKQILFGNMDVPMGTKEASVEITVTRGATGQVEHRRIGYYHRNPIKRMIGNFKIVLENLRSNYRGNTIE